MQAKELVKFEDLGLTTRAKNCFALENISTTEQLMNLTYRQMRKIPNLSYMTAVHVRERLEAHGIIMKY